MKIFGKDVQIGTVLEVVGTIVMLLHFNKTSRDDADIKKELDELEKNSKFGPYIKMVRPFMKINKKGWDDEVMYAEALNEIEPEQRFVWFDLLYDIAVNEPVLFDNFIDYLAHLPKNLRINVIKEIIENCDDKESLKKIIIARSAHSPDASGNKQIIEIFRKWFVETGAKKIETGFMSAGKNIKKAAKKLSTAMDAEVVANGSLNKAAAFRAKMEKRYKERGVK